MNDTKKVTNQEFGQENDQLEKLQKKTKSSDEGFRNFGRISL